MRDNNFYLPIKLAFLELKHGWKHFRIFLACLILGVAVMASVNIFSSVVRSSMNDKAQSILGGDIEVRLRGLEATNEQKQFLKDNYGDVSYISTLRSMMYSGEENLLVEVKAVDEKYPLIGDLKLNNDLNKADAISDNGIIVDYILLDQLGLEIGSIVNIGESEYKITATLESEPDRVLQFFSFGPRVMMSHESLIKSGLVNTFSLIDHLYRIKAKDGIIVDEVFEKQIEKTLLEKFPDYGFRVRTGDDGNNGVNRFLDQLITFLTLSGLSTFLIAGVGIAGSIRFYIEKKYNSIAVLKILGASKNLILKEFLLLISLLSLIGGMFGAAFAIIIVSLILPSIAEILPSLEDKAAFDLNAVLLALFYGVIISLLFSIPTLMSALEIKASSLFRSKLSNLKLLRNKQTILTVFFLAFLLVFTVIINAGDAKFIIVSLAVVLLAFSMLGLLSIAIKKLSKNIRVKKLWMQMAISNINRKGSTSGTVIFAIGVSLTIFITLTLTEQNFQKRLTKIIEEKAPSLFMVDIQPSQKDDFEELLNKYAGKQDIMMVPMLRGRLTKIAGIPIEEARIDDDIDWVTRSDRGITYSTQPPKNADIVEGKWWNENYDGKPLISVDHRMLDGMGVKIGDSLTLNILGNEIEAEIANSRKIDYTTFQINFAMMLSNGVINDFPHSTIATIYLDTENKESELVREISKNFPGITLIRTKEALELLRDAIKSILIALNVTVFITLIAGLLVLTSALSATVRQRIYDIAMLKILGARKNEILKTCIFEWSILAFATSFISITIGTLSSWLLNKKFRATEFDPMPEVIILTTICCVMIVCVIGYVTNNRLFKIKPSELLKNE